MNEVLQRLAHDLDIDLWTLDWLFWLVVDVTETTREGGDERATGPCDVSLQAPERLALGRHLEEFLI